MKKLTLSAALLLAAFTPSTAGDNGRTVCVLRARPVAIQPVPRPVIYRVARVAQPWYAPRYIAGRLCYSCRPGYRVPVTYGHINPRVHYVSPCRPNGYVGGIQNLPSNVIQIPRTFTRPAAAPARSAK